MCVGKALTGGYMTLAATLCTAGGRRGGLRAARGCLMHGPTFMANPLACAVALASLELLAGGDWRAQCCAIEHGLRTGLEPAREAAGGARRARARRDRRHRAGRGRSTSPRRRAAAVERGVWLRPFRDLVYAMPPYVTGDEDLARITGAMVAAAQAGG